MKALGQGAGQSPTSRKDSSLPRIGVDSSQGESLSRLEGGPVIINFPPGGWLVSSRDNATLRGLALFSVAAYWTFSSSNSCISSGEWQLYL